MLGVAPIVPPNMGGLSGYVAVQLYSPLWSAAVAKVMMISLEVTLAVVYFCMYPFFTLVY